ncbi:MAG: 4-(cytidine 5'-diphospho)-2-C-methyl-D-erythritol kinase [Gammaproteobacteria bacterium]|nr:4-(cytidine 5'-diphospho)-2-C-methyl-D-erythritol kinase [Gammaproteobacteria bacterium]MBM4224298.1 4-(cytidine 5'-diphospho)-2-C-methyl-D-erythritol kinase [Gammaproteobacteria bacterium]MBM4229406.1 4-(cytidine 5'-diphospho)-2-C-methyl-D-erythritol kinase [Gammaproteobacteria bacterium]
MSSSALPRSSLVWWPAPAKLNLCLHVTGRRADGYHELQTVFQIIELLDELAFELAPPGIIERCDDAHAKPGALTQIPAVDDLCIRAARALEAAVLARSGRQPAGVRVRIRKRIPMGGGLGGGSSDAATTLLVLNTAWACGFTVDELAAIGLTLGADVPVFLRGASALGEGVGERLIPLELPEKWFLVIHPGVSVPTAAVFQAPELTRNSPILTIPALLASGGRNDCEPVVRQRYPEVAEAIDWLARFAPARLTGTGSCLFASFDSAAAAERVAARVPDRWRAWVVRGVSRSPLIARLQDWASS